MSSEVETSLIKKNTTQADWNAAQSKINKEIWNKSLGIVLTIAIGAGIIAGGIYAMTRGGWPIKVKLPLLFGGLFGGGTTLIAGPIILGIKIDSLRRYSGNQGEELLGKLKGLSRSNDPYNDFIYLKVDADKLVAYGFINQSAGNRIKKLLQKRKEIKQKMKNIQDAHPQCFDWYGNIKTTYNLEDHEYLKPYKAAQTKDLRQWEKDFKAFFSQDFRSNTALHKNMGSDSLTEMQSVETHPDDNGEL